MDHEHFQMTLPSGNPSDAVQTLREGTGIKEVWILASPKAGSGVGREQVDELVERLRAMGIDCQQTANVAELQNRVQELGNQTSQFAVIAAGGDGTISLVASKMPPHVQIIPMPLGTENLLARYYGYTTSSEDILGTLVDNRPFQMDAGLANGRLFLVMATAGFDAEVVRAMHLTRRGHIRRWHYVKPLWRALRRYRFPLIHANQLSAGSTTDAGTDETGSALTSANNPASDSKPLEPAAWMMVFNLPCYASSLPIEPDARGDDGTLNFISLKYGAVLRGLNYALQVWLRRHLQRADVCRQDVCGVALTSKVRVPYQLDGDYAGRLPVRIEVLPKRVTLLRPRRCPIG